jgi:hypothetical protein
VPAATPQNSPLVFDIPTETRTIRPFCGFGAPDGSRGTISAAAASPAFRCPGGMAFDPPGKRPPWNWPR